MPDLQSKRQLPRESFPVFVSFPKFALKLLFSCSYRLVMRRELEEGAEGGEAGRGESNFLLPLGCIYRLPVLAPFPERCHRPLGRLRAPFLHPPFPGTPGCRSGGAGCAGAMGG